ncbi:phage DNA polymerase-associated SH3 family protein [Endozoicomonas sp. ONNA1]|uniref:phage DNA polymerase-associated SH3 family protein n=1 Tax=Endozoicomonas sp. ONNA1 TaxID=2828740 RepID=UPI0021493A2D|nr:phage DNA polymerase-associated SH3 family protein [Endozoicomonas sp. ONNA1]
MEIFTGISLGDTVSFTLYPAGIIGTVYDHCRINALLDAQTARQFIDIDALHANVYPTLPEGTINDPSGYLYLKVKLPSGIDSVVGMNWIDQGTLIRHESMTATFTVDNVDTTDIEKIKLALSANGFVGVNYTIK